jgi:hypothetical protein
MFTRALPSRGRITNIGRGRGRSDSHAPPNQDPSDGIVAPNSTIDWQLNIAIADAAGDLREAPWYGPWNIVLVEFMFRNFCPSPFVTITYPQFPVTHDADTFNPEDDSYDDDDDDDEDEDDEDDIVMRYSAPSPEVFKGSRQDLPQTPPNPDSLPFQPLQTPPESKSMSYKPQKKRSTRIPDFVQLIYKVARTANTIDDPPHFTKRILLLVEIKRKVLSFQPWSFVEVFPQTDQQARRAFAAFSDTSTIGVIIALGDCWTYREYHRNEIEASPSRSEQEDSTFVLSSPPVMSWSRTYAPLDQFFGAEGYARLQYAKSNKALQTIREHLQNLCADM